MWNCLNWETFEMKLTTVSSMHSACLPGLIHPSLSLLHSQAPATAVLRPKDCPIFHCIDTLPHSQGTQLPNPKSDKELCASTTPGMWQIEWWIMNWVEDIMLHFLCTSMSVKSQRLRRTRHQRVLKTFILHHLVATVHRGQCGRQDAAWQHKKISNVSVQPQINADNDSLGARLNMRRKREQVRHKQDHLLKSPHCSIGTCMNQWINPRPHNNSIIWQIISDNYITPHRPSMHWSSQSVWVNLS